MFNLDYHHSVEEAEKIIIYPLLFSFLLYSLEISYTNFSQASSGLFKTHLLEK